MTVRSKTLGTFNGAAAAGLGSLVYTCPANLTALVKTWSVYSGASGGTQVGFFIVRLSGALSVLSIQNPVAGTIFDSAQEPFWVLEPTEQVRVNSATGLVFVFASVDGAELQGLAP